MRVMLRLKFMVKGSLLTVLGHRKRPENLVEFMTTAIEASVCWFWTEKAGRRGKSFGELK